MAKTCQIKECNNPIFGGGFCKYHQYKRKMQGGDLFVRKSKKPIKKESPKQKKITKRYLERLKDFWDNAVNTNTNHCFFCGKYMEHRENIHHVRGRGSVVLEEEFWVLCHQICHSKYHSYTIEKLMQESWWGEYMSRIKIKDISTYYKELNKINKSKDLFGNDENVI